MKRSSEEYNVISSKPEHKFNKKIYGDQYEFNVKISAILRKALLSRDELDKQTHINEGIELINKRNKLLVLTDAHGWEVQTKQVAPSVLVIQGIPPLRPKFPMILT